MSTINNAINLSVSEKERHNLHSPFKTVPAMKIAKLAVSQTSYEKYKGVVSFMITADINLTWECYAIIQSVISLRQALT
jgi:hypothetical protein